MATSLSPGMIRIPIGSTGLYITLSTSPNGLMSAVLNRKRSRKVSWRTLMQVMERYYEMMGAELRELVGEQIVESLKRPNVSTGRLLDATLDERNFYRQPDGFGIGYAPFLDQSVAKYWRQIEQGTSIHVGRELYGVFGATLTGGWAESKRGNRYALAGPTYTYPGKKRGGKFQPRSTLPNGAVIERAKRPKARRGFDRVERPPSPVMRIGRPIEAMEAYEHVFEAYRRSNRPFVLFRAAVSEILDLPKVSGRSYQSIIDNYL